jgi:hypothetical protein
MSTHAKPVPVADRTRLTFAVAVLVAAGLALTPLPAVVRAVLCLPVLVGVVGHAVARLLVRETDIPGPVLAALFGLLGLGVVTLGLHVTGLGIRTPGAAIGMAGLALVLLAVPGPMPAVVLPRRHHVLGAAAALVVLGLATAGAVAMQPADDTPFTQLTLVAAPESVRAGAGFDVRWTLDDVEGVSHLTAPTTPGLWSTPVRVGSDELVLNVEVTP